MDIYRNKNDFSNLQTSIPQRSRNIILPGYKKFFTNFALSSIIDVKERERAIMNHEMNQKALESQPPRPQCEQPQSPLAIDKPVSVDTLNGIDDPMDHLYPMWTVIGQNLSFYRHELEIFDQEDRSIVNKLLHLLKDYRSVDPKDLTEVCREVMAQGCVIPGCVELASVVISHLALAEYNWEKQNDFILSQPFLQAVCTYCQDLLSSYESSPEAAEKSHWYNFLRILARLTAYIRPSNTPYGSLVRVMSTALKLFNRNLKATDQEKVLLFCDIMEDSGPSLFDCVQDGYGALSNDMYESFLDKVRSLFLEPSTPLELKKKLLLVLELNCRDWEATVEMDEVYTFSYNQENLYRT